MEITNLKTQVETYLIREDFLVPKGSSPSPVSKINFKFSTYLTNQQLCGIRAIPSLQNRGRFFPLFYFTAESKDANYKSVRES